MLQPPTFSTGSGSHGLAAKHYLSKGLSGKMSFDFLKTSYWRLILISPEASSRQKSEKTRMSAHTLRGHEIVS